MKGECAFVAHPLTRARTPALHSYAGMLHCDTVHRSPLLPVLAALLAATAWMGVAAAAYGAEPAPIDPTCDSADFATLLQPQAGSTAEPRAYWLDRRLLQWPNIAETGRFRLYYSAQAGLSANRGARVSGQDGMLALEVHRTPVPQALATRFKFVAAGVALQVKSGDLAKIPSLLTQQVLLVREDDAGKMLDAASLQTAGALDDLYSQAALVDDLGVKVAADATGFKVWAPTARAVSLCLYPTGRSKAIEQQPMRRDATTGLWSTQRPGDLSGSYYAYLVDVFVPGVGTVRNRVTDPYSVSLSVDSKRSYIADLGAGALKPDGWDATPFPNKVKTQTDMSIYELHVRDFSINDASVAAAHRGKYLAFTERDSRGMRHLRALSDAGLTDVHLLPVFDFATVPESGCVTPDVPDAAADSEAQQAAVMAVAARDCFNWGYDPYHFNAPEGSYASDADDGAKRILEFRRMVMALHRAGLRVGMDVVYNHTTTSGQQASSVLDRLVPGYYQRLDASGKVERSTCCDNTATEHTMMAKLMIDSAVLWAVQYKIDSFRFDLMGHQPRAAMETLRERVNAATGRNVNLIGEGWNFGEVADGARFVQASQLSLNGSGIGTFSDRARDALRGGGPSDSGEALLQRQGWLNGLVYDRNASAPERPRADLLKAADLVRVGLAGSIRDYPLTDHQDSPLTLDRIDYSGQPAGYASQPDEVVNYVENHDNQTLYDNNVYKLPRDTSTQDRARVQALGLAVNAFSQGVAYFHAGVDTLRSKSLDRNSFDSGDWFNRLDWTYTDNYFGTGLPPKTDNAANHAMMKPLLGDAALKPAPRDIAWTRDVFRDLLRIRASSTLFRLRSAEDIKQRLRFRNTGAGQNPVLIAGHLDGAGYPGAGFKEVLYLLNADAEAHTLELREEIGKPYVLHPVQRGPAAADRRVVEARYRPENGRFTVPARTSVVYVVE